MTTKAVFLDVDGTLINGRGEVPESAREAVHRARANGHLVFLATGRSQSHIVDEVLDIGFDGAITGAGAHVEVDGQELRRSAMTAEQVTRVMDFLDRHEVDYILESTDGLIGTADTVHRVRHFMYETLADKREFPDPDRGSQRFMRGIHVDADPLSMPVHKFGIFDSPVTLDVIRDAFDGEFVVIPATVAAFGARSGELSPVGVHKAVGIDLVCQHLGIDRANTVALGDGMNDLEMLAHVGVGVAMGGAPQAVVDVADAVTGSPDEDGLRDAFVRFGLIEPALRAA